MPTQNEKHDQPQLNPCLVDFWLTPGRNKVLYGGRGSSKSWDAAAFAIFLAQHYRVKFLCTRQFQNKIEESVYTLLKEQIFRFGLAEYFRILNNKILCPYTGSEFVFYGLWRHIEEIKSLEGVDICWIEEAASMTENQFSILEPTIRKEDSQFWIIFNPDVITDFVYQKFVVSPPADTVVRKINYTENPFLSQTSLKIIQAMKEEDPEEYAHIYGGEPRVDDEAVIIKRKWLMAAVDAHLKLKIEPLGGKRCGFDIADDGGDRCVNVLTHGPVALSLDAWKANEDQLMKSCKKTYHNALIWDAEIVYDGTGVGAMAGSKFEEINELNDENEDIEYIKFQAGASVMNPESEYANKVKNKDMFSNLKAQCWWSVADRLRNTWDAVTNGTQYPDDELICISSEMDCLEGLITELSTPKKDYDNTSRVKVESKKDLLAREVPSPDLADAFVMAFAPIHGTGGFLDVFVNR